MQTYCFFYTVESVYLFVSELNSKFTQTYKFRW